LASGAKLIRSAPGNVALLFGSEKFGLSNDDLSHCHWLMRIPTVDQKRSMNLGQAVAVCLYEIARSARKPPEPTNSVPATMGEIEQITAMLIEASRRSGYLNPVVASSTENKVRRMIRRLDIRARDVSIWLGILRQILWKLGNTE
jgi:tRNA/rRNA methyltransferase